MPEHQVKGNVLQVALFGALLAIAAVLLVLASDHDHPDYVEDVGPWLAAQEAEESESLRRARAAEIAIVESGVYEVELKIGKENSVHLRRKSAERAD